MAKGEVAVDNKAKVLAIVIPGTEESNGTVIAISENGELLLNSAEYYSLKLTGRAVEVPDHVLCFFDAMRKIREDMVKHEDMLGKMVQEILRKKD